MLTRTPIVGQVLVYRNRKECAVITVRVLEVYAAVCVVESTGPVGLRDEPIRFRVHMALLFPQ